MEVGENSIMWSFVVCTFYQVKEDEMSRANNTYCSESLKGRDLLKD